ncbi:terminase large subunit domain-containing protein [Altererythrobacter sp. CAU 1778]
MSAEDPFAFAGDASDADIHDFSETLDEETLFSLARYWDGHFPLFAHDGQRTPQGDWRIWMVMGGRGFGKTRAGAEYVRAIAEGDRFARIALVGATLGEARRVMIEGDSGLIQCAPPEQRPEFEPSLNRLTWPNGAQAFVYSAAEPEALRGPQHSHADWSGPEGIYGQSGHRADRRAAAARGAWTRRRPALRRCRRGRMDRRPFPRRSWSDQPGALAVLTENEWRFVNPVERMQIFDSTAGSIAVWRDGAWWWPQAVTSPTGGGTIDAEARAALGALQDELRAAGILPT